MSQRHTKPSPSRARARGLSAIGLAAILAACGRQGEPVKTVEAEPAAPRPAIRDLPAGAQEEEAIAADLDGAPPVDHRWLRSLLPQGLTGFKRTNVKSETSGFGDSVTSVAEAEYEGVATAGGEKRTFAIRISDLAGMGGPEPGDAAAPSQGPAEISLVVADRFVVKLEGRNVSMEDAKAAFSRIDIGKLTSVVDKKKK